MSHLTQKQIHAINRRKANAERKASRQREQRRVNTRGTRRAVAVALAMGQFDEDVVRYG